MYFASFQPTDWRTAVKKDGYRDIYSDVMGFNGMYCFPAERLSVAAINAAFVVPTTPEIVVWFKTNEWFCVPKIDHYQHLDKGPKPVCFPRGFLVQQYKSDGHYGRFEDFLMEMMPYHFEFLVNRDAIRPIAETDIKAVVSKAFMANKNYDEAQQKQIQDVIDYNVGLWKEDYEDATASWMTQERAVRDATAITWYRWYCLDNDLFITDYKRIIGMKSGEKDVTMKRLNMVKLDMLISMFNEYPSEKNFEKFVRYMERNIYV